MSEIRVSLVPPEHVTDVWPAIRRYVEKAVKMTSGKYEPEDVLGLVTEYHYPLWIAFDDTDIKGAVITRFIDYPRKRYLFLEFCGGKDGHSWKDAMLDILRRWAKQNGCAGIEAAGRAGWKKIFEHDGYKPTLSNFELALD